MRIATFNVNSLRARVDRVIAFLERNEIDVLAIQETKATDAKFPLEPFTDAGYQVARHGISQWNGVAIASRVGLTDVQIGLSDCPSYGDPPVVEARAIGARCGGVEVWSLYIPNGREIDHPHYVYKLDWLAALRAMGAAKLAADPADSIVLCGDFNVAPQDSDVWDMAVFEGHTHVTEPEREAFAAVVAAGFTDVVRPILPGKEGDTYWDYQQLRYVKKEGMRIDFLLGSPALAGSVTSAFVDREERKGKGASDHAPVVVELDRVAEPLDLDAVAAAPIVGPTVGPAVGPAVAAAAESAAEQAVEPAVAAAAESAAESAAEQAVEPAGAQGSAGGGAAGTSHDANSVIPETDGAAPLW